MAAALRRAAQRRAARVGQGANAQYVEVFLNHLHVITDVSEVDRADLAAA